MSSCEGCRYFKPLEGLAKGVCHVRPPRLSHDGDWLPVVSEGCGEWKGPEKAAPAESAAGRFIRQYGTADE